MARVLVADDDPDVRDVVVFKLQQSGHDVLVAQDGGAALDLARRALPDLAVLDVMMPRVTGLDVCRELRADPATAVIPVILLTARAQEGDIESGFAWGADDYLTQPFSPRELDSRVRAVLARRR